MARPTVQEIESRLTTSVAEMLGRPAADIDAATPLHTLGIDSLHLIELLVSIERTWGLNLIESDLSRVDFASLRSLAAGVHQEL